MILKNFYLIWNHFNIGYIQIRLSRIHVYNEQNYS